MLLLALSKGTPPLFCDSLTAFLASIPYDSHASLKELDMTEKHFQYTFYLILRLIGVYCRAIHCENRQSFGRVDCILEMDEYVYIFEFKIGTNTTYLSNAVNNYFGCNFKQLLNKYRVEYAKSLLLEGTYSTSSLFRKCGFASQSVFYAAFHKVVGASPLQFLYKAPSKRRKRFKVLL
ncbi:helix-turn-helix domain-containing protein [Phocaeicola dorei]|nr:helix-turn-helix domain-containing protein [Phocaeicola dorei]